MPRRYAVKIDGREHTVEIEEVEAEAPGGGAAAGGGGKLRVRVDGRERLLDVRELGAGSWSLLAGAEARRVDVDGTLPKLTVEVSHPDGEPRLLGVEVAGAAGTRASRDGAPASPPAATGPTTLRAPIPGKVVKVLVRAGDRARAGQPLVVIEAMKMENELRAPREATVAALHVAEGAAVETGQELVSLAAPSTPAAQT